jgi:hypothetical protein
VIGRSAAIPGGSKPQSDQSRNPSLHFHRFGQNFMREQKDRARAPSDGEHRSALYARICRRAAVQQRQRPSCVRRRRLFIGWAAPSLERACSSSCARLRRAGPQSHSNGGSCSGAARRKSSTTLWRRDRSVGVRLSAHGRHQEDGDLNVQIHINIR